MLDGVAVLVVTTAVLWAVSMLPHPGGTATRQSYHHLPLLVNMQR
jgi:hypothetical protein